MNTADFLESLSSIRLKNVFNPYIDRCPSCDLPDAAKKRYRVLEAILSQACEQQIAALWIARDLGYLGGRRTGLALTDDAHYSAHLQRWGIEEKELPCRGDPIQERTASVVWGELLGIKEAVFLWNVFPFHPHDPDNEFSNRAHTRSEREIGIKFLASLIQLIKPKQIVAIGNDASSVLGRLNYHSRRISVRHPSYGGANIFRTQIRSLSLSACP